MDYFDRQAHILARLDAPAHAKLMLRALLMRENVSLESIRQDPILWLTDWAEVEVFDLASVGVRVDGRCAVDGLYRGEDVPPRIGIAYSDTQQRMNFTALHELGHHIQMTDENLAMGLIERPDGGTALEEAACDAFAAAILIPDHIASAALGSGTPSAESVATLWESLGTVSRSAVAIRAIRQIEGEGHIVVLNADGEVTFSTSTTAIRPGRHSDQTGTPIWAAIERAPSTSTASARGQFNYKSVPAGDTYYMQAARAGAGYIIVAATERVPWLTLSIARRETTAYGQWYTCSHLVCTAVFLAGPSDVCEVCNFPTCPECGRCACTVAAHNEFTCSECFLLKGAAQASSTMNICIDCA
jgi:Zn-dependent peptidase ImmA (M78 family)